MQGRREKTSPWMEERVSPWWIDDLRSKDAFTGTFSFLFFLFSFLCSFMQTNSFVWNLLRLFSWELKTTFTSISFSRIHRFHSSSRVFSFPSDFWRIPRKFIRFPAFLRNKVQSLFYLRLLFFLSSSSCRPFGCVFVTPSVWVRRRQSWEGRSFFFLSLFRAFFFADTLL